MSKYFEIRWHGRGGQGTVTGAKSLAEAVQSTGKNISAFPEYGPERRGAPLRAFNRFSDDDIRIHTSVKNPDVVIIADSILIGNAALTEGIKKNTIFIVTSIFLYVQQLLHIKYDLVPDIFQSLFPELIFH